MVIDLVRWIIFGILYFDFTKVCSYGVMCVNYCFLIKLSLFTSMYKLGENNKWNYHFRYIKWLIPVFRIWDVPNEVPFTLNDRCKSAARSSFLLYSIRPIHWSVGCCWLRSQLFEEGKIERVSQFSILIWFFFSEQLVFIMSHVTFCVENLTPFPDFFKP